MAESVIDLVLNKLYRVVTEEVDLQREVKQEIQNLREELKIMKPFLRYVDVQKVKDPRFESWVEQVRDVAFEIEDVVDEYLLRVVYGGGDDAGDAHSTCLRRIFSPFKKLKGNHRICSDLRSIKEKAKEIAERPKRYGYVDLSQVNLHEQGSSSSKGRDRLEIELFRRSSAPWVDESKLVGIDQIKEVLVGLLNDGDMNLKVIAIVGMGGMGKTALARKIYREMSQFQRRAFITVSQTLNEEDFVKDMMQQLFLEEEMLEMQNLSKDRLKEGMRERLRDESYLIVVDDVWKIQHWDKIKVLFPRNKHGSRIVVTTRMSRVAKHSCREYNGDIYPLQPLSNDASWKLFCKRTFPTTQICPSNLVDMCQDIVFNKCMGLPIAILAISGLLRNKNECELDAWVKNVQHSLGTELEDNEQLEMMGKILSLSFDDLPHHVKPCYMYLSIFPEDYEIEWERVIRLWISEGFVTKQGGRTVEEYADSYLWELVDRNLIQIAQTKGDGTGRPSAFRIHDSLREIVLSKSKQERFVEVISKVEEMEIRARRLSIHDNSNALKRLSQLIPIRSLIMFFPTRGVNAKLANDGLKLRLLGMLDLQGALLYSFPPEICTLLLLRYLSLRRTRISYIPKFIRNLARLETLDLMDTRVTELPNQISMLQNLRHLLIYSWDHISFVESCAVKVTSNIGGLVWLQELRLIEVAENGEIVKALGNLTQLRKLGLGRLKKEECREACWCISRMRNLLSLTLKTEERFELEYLRSPPAGLEELELDGELEELPSWMSPSSLRNLLVVRLSNTRLKKDPGATLGSFPNLAGLFLSHNNALDDGVKMRVLLPASFPSLKSLALEGIMYINGEGVIDEVTWKRAISDLNPNRECPIVLDIVIPLT